MHCNLWIYLGEKRRALSLEQNDGLSFIRERGGYFPCCLYVGGGWREGRGGLHYGHHLRFMIVRPLYCQLPSQGSCALISLIFLCKVVPLQLEDGYSREPLISRVVNIHQQPATISSNNTGDKIASSLTSKDKLKKTKIVFHLLNEFTMLYLN